jgi:hypothetical protein
MVIENFLQFKNKTYNLMDKQGTRFYLVRVCTVLKLHLNEHQLNSILSLL